MSKSRPPDLYDLLLLQWELDKTADEVFRLGRIEGSLEEFKLQTDRLATIWNEGSRLGREVAAHLTGYTA